MSFRHKSSLSRHTKIHLKTTECHLCHRSFRYESFLKKHLITAHQEEDAINQPQYNAFSKDYRSRYAAENQTQTREDELSNEPHAEECEVIGFEDQNHVIQLDTTQYHYGQPTVSGVIVNNLHSYT